MTTVLIDGFVFDAKKFLYAEQTGSGIHIYIQDAKKSLFIPTRTQILGREKLKEVQSVVNGALKRGCI